MISFQATYKNQDKNYVYNREIKEFDPLYDQNFDNICSIDSCSNNDRSVIRPKALYTSNIMIRKIFLKRFSMIIIFLRGNVYDERKK